MARQTRNAQCGKQLSWVVYAETFLAVVACSYITMQCFDVPEEDLFPSMGVAPFPFPATIAKLEEGALIDTAPPAAPGLMREEPVKDAKDAKPQCSKLPAFTTTFVIAFMAGGFMNVERIQGLPIP